MEDSDRLSAQLGLLGCSQAALGCAIAAPGCGCLLALFLFGGGIAWLASLF